MKNNEEPVVTIVVPKDISYLENIYSKALAEIVADMLTIEELEYIISKYS